MAETSFSKPPIYKGYIETEKESGSDERACFLPQPEDVGKGGKAVPEQKEMAPIGQWATGKVDWGPLAGLTGTRPVVDQYTVSRYSAEEWRKHNEEVLSSSAGDLHRINMAEYNSRKGLKNTAISADKTQFLNTKRLAERTNEILKWKEEIKRSLEELLQETKLLEQERRRLNQARVVIRQVHSICSECISCRTKRVGHDLSRDKTEEELIKEAALIKEVSDLFERTSTRVQEQLVRNKAMQKRLEADWSDKQEAFHYEITNVNLKNESNTILFKPAATRFNENQTSPEGWEKASKELLMATEVVMTQSCELRVLVNGPVLQDCVRDLKAQADKVDIALAKGVTDTEECIKAMYAELEVIARRNAECETLKADLANGIRGLDKAMKVAQTRLDTLHQRPGIENCRDKSQFGLVDEVKTISEHSTALKSQLAEAEEALLNLIRSRTIIEKELQTKLKTIYIDKHRCQIIRTQYPSATAMSGFMA